MRMVRGTANNREIVTQLCHFNHLAISFHAAGWRAQSPAKTGGADCCAQPNISLSLPDAIVNWA